MASVAYTNIAVDFEAPSIDVSWLGDAPPWLELDDARAALDGLALSFEDDGGAARILHVGAASLRRLGAIRRARPNAAVVLDLCGEEEGRLSWRDARAAAGADLILLGSLAELQAFRQRHARLAERTALFVRPVDLDAHAPLKQLHKTRDAQIKRFRRMHRLAGPVVLYAGPYTRDGGLDLTLEAVYTMRERSPELRFAAIPHGAIDQDYLDRCERRALALGHHGIIEWNPDPTDVPLWYALASIVCTPARRPVGSTSPKLAAAAGRPFVGSDLPCLAENVVEGKTGFLVSPDDLDTLTAALEALLGDEDEASRLGAGGLEWAAEHLSPAGAAKRLRRLWSEGAERGPQLATIRDRRGH